MVIASPSPHSLAVGARGCGRIIAFAGFAIGPSVYYFQSNTHLESSTWSKTSNGGCKSRIPIDFVDRLAGKSYLITDVNSQQMRNSRPKGIPDQLRIMAIDVPQMRTDAFFGNGICRVSAKHVFPEHVAPSKRKKQEQRKGKNDGASSNGVAEISIPQKALVHSMIQCMMTTTNDHNSNAMDNFEHSPKISLLEASIAKLNPNNLRKTRSFGNYKYDPGKYTRRRNTSSKDDDSSDNKSNNKNHAINDLTKEEEYLNNVERIEMDAPWNQYAWIEELKLRISGRVRFDAAMEPSSSISRYLFGNVYKSTVHSDRKLWEYLLPLSFLSSTSKSTGAGLDGTNNDNNWSSNKPHAVIANGAALQRVPTSLTILKKYCAQNEVPLFVVDDPRQLWGGNTHATFQEAIRDMRKIIKRNIIIQCMQQQNGFYRGKLVGKMEQKLINEKDKFQLEKQHKQHMLKERRWGSYDMLQLEKKLIEYGVIQIVYSDIDGNQLPSKQYTAGMKELIQQFIADNEYQKHQDDSTDGQNREDEGFDDASGIPEPDVL